MYSKEINIAKKLIKNRDKDGVNLLINLIVRIHKAPNPVPSEKEKTAVLLGEVLADKINRKTLLEILGNIDSSIVYFLGNLAAEFGYLKEATVFTEEAYSIENMPLHLINLYIDLLDSSMEREKAIDQGFLYLATHPNLSLGGLTAEKFLTICKKQDNIPIEDISHSTTHLDLDQHERFHDSVNPKIQTGNRAEYKPAQTDDDLNFLHLIFKIVKICYVQGKIELASRICRFMDPFVAACGDLNATPIKNGYSYFQFIAKMIPLKPLDPKADMRIYIMGDSHCLSPAWNLIEVESKPCLIQPLLITGCKLWHLRDASHIHVKVNYVEALDSIPEGSTLIYILGEIDCREGILPAVEKGRYPNAEAAMKVLLKIYMDRVKEAIRKKKLAHVYIHLVPPALDFARPTIMAFNQLLRKTVLGLKKEGVNISWLGFKDNLLLENGQLNPLFYIDGTHLHPRYFNARQVE